ncbi:meiotically upregulated protein Mug97 [Schizosaccharomyces osmophilus]|uniref:Meiotically upregulated protein Mug97 n=1 Tax=Schizosaccharomyces osmophilus TaxID=2545709 RepID=A0AAE9W6Q8_9SCHI|nr:meiotically upregulated protein Mug97 [Schizosaccharomyces osmophilus]WBW70618.1 meiotically upregulated protein Mug97 [Schizosaccharomyces osmophilus]
MGMSKPVASNTDMKQESRDDLQVQHQINCNELQDQNDAGFYLQTNEGDLPGLTGNQIKKPLTSNSSIKEDPCVSEKPKLYENDEERQSEYYPSDSENQLARSLHSEAFQKPDDVKGQHLQVYTQEFHVQTPLTPQSVTDRTVVSPTDDISPTESVVSTKPDSVFPNRQGHFASGSESSSVFICLYHKQYGKWHLKMSDEDDNQAVEAYAQHFSSENRPSIFYLFRGISFGPEYDYVLRPKNWWNPMSEKVMRKEVVVRKIDTQPGCRSVYERYHQNKVQGGEDLLIVPVYGLNIWIVSLIVASAAGSVIIGLWMRLSDPFFAHGMLLNLGLGSIGSFLYLLSNTWCR